VGSPEEVKAHFPGSILEVRCADPRRAAAILRKEFPSASVALFGDRVHVGTQDPGVAAHEIEKALAAAGVPRSTVQPFEPALEDVFVAVISARQEGRP
jgi:ABC-2 type transport system ATP-binding protein